MIHNKKEIEIINDCRETHVQWADYFEENPEQLHNPYYEKLGGILFHRDWVDKYDEVIHKLKTTVPVSVVIWIIIAVFLFGAYCGLMIATH